MNFYDEDVLSKANNIIYLETSDNIDKYFNLLEECYPILGTKVYWQKTRNNKYKKADSENLLTDYISFFNEIITTYKLDKHSSDIVYFGDNLTELCYLFNLENVDLFLPIIVDIPHHHYFMPVDGKWCISFTLENDLEFGYSPKY